jgi:hypothetical protein
VRTSNSSRRRGGLCWIDYYHGRVTCLHAHPRNEAAVETVAKKGTSGPVKARDHASRRKTMVLAIFDSHGMVYSKYLPRGITVNAKYIIRALGAFLKNLRKKRPETVKKEWFLHWDNAPVHTTKVVQEFLVKKNINLLHTTKVVQEFLAKKKHQTALPPLLFT